MLPNTTSLILNNFSFLYLRSYQSCICLYTKVKRGVLIQPRLQNQVAVNSSKTLCSYVAVFRVLIPVFDPLNNWEWGRAGITDFIVWKEAKPFSRG